MASPLPARGRTDSDGGPGRGAELLSVFDEAWVSYLEQFAAWKCADAALLEVCDT